MVNIHKIKLEICDIGDRIYKKGFAAGNDGNISFRISEKEVICTPTMTNKGYLKPDDLCTVDMEGNQLSGHKKRTSEIMLHLATAWATDNQPKTAARLLDQALGLHPPPDVKRRIDTLRSTLMIK